MLVGCYRVAFKLWPRRFLAVDTPHFGCRHTAFKLWPRRFLLLAACLLLGKGQKYEDVLSVVRAHPLRLIKKLVELCQLVVRTQHFFNLVLVELRHQVASRTAVFAGVELGRLFGKHLANSSGEGQARV